MQITIYKKKHKNKKSKTNHKFFSGVLHFGIIGLKAQTSGILTQNQVETVRRVVAQVTKRNSKVKIRVFFKHPLTKKPLLTRMGKGAGPIKSWICYIKAGTIILEVSNVQIQLAKIALQIGQQRLPIKTKIVYKDFF